MSIDERKSENVKWNLKFALVTFLVHLAFLKGVAGDTRMGLIYVPPRANPRLIQSLNITLYAQIIHCLTSELDSDMHIRPSAPDHRQRAKSA